MSEIAPPEALRHMHCFTAGMPHGVQRCPVVEAARFDDERVALPAPGGISEICGELEGSRKVASIRENLAAEVVDFVQYQRHLGRLNDFEWFSQQPCHRPAILAMANVVDPPLGGPLLHQRLCFRPQRQLSGLEISEDVERVLVYRFEL